MSGVPIAPPPPAMPMYEISLVGADQQGFRGTADRLQKQMNRIMQKVTEEAYTFVMTELQIQQFKKSTGNINRAVGYSWDETSGEGSVYVDTKIAPYAICVERGVKTHVMRYLLKAKRPIPVPSQKTGNIKFRWATEKWMGRPHLIELDEDEGGGWYMTKGWTHPGYEGRHFFRQGIKSGVASARSHLRRNWVFRVRESGVEVDQ